MHFSACTGNMSWAVYQLVGGNITVNALIIFYIRHLYIGKGHITQTGVENTHTVIQRDGIRIFFVFIFYVKTSVNLRTFKYSDPFLTLSYLPLF